MSLSRVTVKNFLDNWQKLSNEEQLQHKEFQNLHGQFCSGSLSCFKGDGSLKFAQEVAAANAITRRHVEKVQVLLFHTDDGCIVITNKCGSTGVTKIDNTHVDLRMTDSNYLQKVLNSMTDEDYHDINERDIYQTLADLRREQPSLDNEFIKHFSANTVEKINQF